MIDKKRIIERIKSAVIVLLLLSAVFLLYNTGYYSGVFDFFDRVVLSNNDFSQDSDSQGTELGQIVASPAKQFSLCFGPGGRYASAYDGEVVEEDYSRFSAFLAEALGSASQPRTVDEAEWIKALESESVYINYFVPQHLEVLSSQLGTEMSSMADVNVFADEFCLSCESGGEVKLLFKSDNEYYFCDTAVSASALRERIAEYVPTESAFSYSDKLLYGIKNSTLVLKDFDSVRLIESSGIPASAQQLEMLMPAFGINEYTTSYYKEADGTSVYVDSNCVLRLSPYGHALYELSGDASVRASDKGFPSAIELCWEIIGATVGQSCGNAEVYLSGCEVIGEGNYIFTFDYMFNGVPIHIGSRHAAVINIENSALIKAEIIFKSYISTGDSVNILPMYQAAAMASAKSGEGLELKYYDSTDKIECLWVNE